MENYDGKVLRIREVGDPILYTKCKKIDVKNMTEEDFKDIEDLKASLDFSGGYGIAAPQVGINKRIIIIQVDAEKCIYKVERYKDIEVTYYDEAGIRVKKNVSGFTARDIQHECDHLDGIVFLEKVVSNGYATLDMIKHFELRKEI